MRVREALPLVPELLRTLWALPSIEWGRRTEGPEPLLERLRRRARKRRSPEARSNLRRVIRWVDARMVGGANCYRRVLLETRLDAGAAREKVVFGLRPGSSKGSGHAWLESEAEGDGYEVRFRL